MLNYDHKQQKGVQTMFFPEMSEKFDIVLKNVMLAKKQMGSVVKKDAANPFHKSKYATLGAHLELCESALDENGLILFHTINEINEKSILIATLCHVESGQWIKSYLPLPNPKNDSQGLGSAITYMRRYSINSLLGLTAEDDDGESACIREKKDNKTFKVKQIDLKEEKEKQENPLDFITEDQVKELAELFSACGDTYKSNFLKHFQITTLDGLMKSQFDLVKNNMQKQITNLASVSEFKVKQKVS